MSEQKVITEEEVQEEKIEITDSEFNDRLNNSFQVGISSGLQTAAEYLMTKAKFHFMREKDEKAGMLREYSQELDRMATEAHPNKN